MPFLAQIKAGIVTGSFKKPNMVLTKHFKQNESATSWN
jgi:hypothetical protein